MSLPLVLLVLCAAAASAQVYPFQDWRLSPEDRAADLVPRLSLQEKAELLVSMQPPVPRLNISGYNWRSECCHGWGFTGSDWKGSGWNGTATIFPHVIGLAAMFDETLVEAVGDAAASEGRAAFNMARSQGIFGHMMTSTHCFGPTTDLVRDPRWGRIKRTWGEDPFLIGVLNSAHIRGLQGRDPKRRKISADVNMFAVHNGPDSIRTQFSAFPSQRDVRESFLPGFRMSITEGNVDSVMVAYSAINGTPDNCNEFLLKDVLRRDWNFTGVAFSDNSGVALIADGQHFAKDHLHAAALALNAGLDQDMASGGPGDKGKWDFGDTVFATNLVQAVQQNLTSETLMDAALRRVLTVRYRTGADDPEYVDPWADLGPETIGSQSHLDLALQTARKSLTLLKNDNQTLPFSSSKTKVAVIGPNADNAQVLFGGTYAAFPSQNPVTVLAGVKALVGRENVVFSEGCDTVVCANKSAFAAARTAAASADVIIYVGGIDGSHIEHEGGDRGTPEHHWMDGFPCEGQPGDVIGMPGCQDALLDELAGLQKPLVNVVLSGGPVTTSNSAPAQLMAFYPGQAGGQAVADVIFGRYSPAGRLPYTVFQSAAQLPNFESYDMRNGTGFTYRFTQVKPQFAFGDGLSYASFEYTARVVRKPASLCDAIVVGVNVTLAGESTWADVAEEVVQVYAAFAPSEPLAARPPAPSLQGLARVALAAGTSPTRSLTFELTPWQRSMVLSNGTRVVGPGTVQLTAGGGQASSALVGDAVQRLEVQVPGAGAVPVEACGPVRMRGAWSVL